MAAIDNPQDRYNFIRQNALQVGADPALIDRLVRSEGGYKTFDTSQDYGTSFGPFAMHVAGTHAGTTVSGLGDEFRKATGLNPADPNNETQLDRFALEWGAQHGFTADTWHGLRRGGGGGGSSGTLPAEGEYGGATHINVTPTEQNGLSPGGALLLSSLLQNAHPEERQQDTGNSLLNMILSQQGPSREQIPQQHPSEQYIEPLPAPAPPATVPDLQPGPLPTPAAPLPLPTGPTPPMPGQPSVPAPSAPAGPVMPAATPTAPQPVSPAPAPAPAAAGSFNPLNLLMGTAHAAEAARPPARPPGAPAVPTTGTGSRLLDGLLHNIIAGSRAGGPVLGPAMRALTPPPTTVPGEEEHAQAPPLERMMTGTGIVPPATTDIQQAQAEQRAQQAGPLSPVERLTQLGGAVTPFIAGGAPGGAVSSGLRLRGRGLPAAERIEPTFGPRPAAPGAAPVEAATQAAEAKAGLPSPEPVSDIEPPTMDGKTLGIERQKVQDKLNSTVRARYADSIQATQFVEALPEKWRTQEFQAKVPDEIEKRLIDPNAKLDPEVEAYLKAVKPYSDLEKQLGERVRRHGLTEEQEEQLDLTPLRGVQQGHIHRMPVGGFQPGEIMPTAPDPITGATRGRSLGKQASGMMHRTRRYVSEDRSGTRFFSKNILGKEARPVPQGYTRFYSADGNTWTKTRPEGVPSKFIDYPSSRLIVSKGGKYSFPNSADLWRSAHPSPAEKYGDKVYQAGKVYTVREPTMLETEANVPGIKYHRNHLLGLINNVNRMAAVDRNLTAIEDLRRDLEDAGLWVRRGNRYLHSGPEGFERVEMPQLDGWAHPRIANTINDFTRGAFHDPDLFEKINHYLIGSMFLLPVGHIRNVGMHYTTGRGLDWAYRNPRLAKSFNEVWNLGPIYQRFLRENGPAMYPGAADIHGKLVQKLLHDIANDPGWEITAKGLRTTVPKLVKAMYDWSSRSLWFSNDHMFLARTMENLAKHGFPDPLKAPSEAWQKAIMLTKREIPPYEIPDRVLGSRPLKNLLMSPVFAFGRYTYDKYDILAKNVIDMLGRGPEGKGFPQVEAAAKALLTLMLAFPVHSVLQSAIQKISGNENAKLYGAGPTSIIRMAGGAIGKMAGVDPDSTMGYMLGMNDGELDLSHGLSNLINFTPALDAMVKVFGGGHDPYTGQPIIGRFASPAGVASGVTQMLMNSLFPTQIALEAIQQGPGALTSPLGFNLGGFPPPSGRSLKFQRRMERGREKRDPVTQFFEGVMP